MYTVENFNQCKKFSEFDYWFHKTGKLNYTVYSVNRLESEPKIIGSFVDDGSLLYSSELAASIKDAEVANFHRDWADFQERPEYFVYNRIEPEVYSEDPSFYYEMLLLGCALIKCFLNTLKDPDDVVIQRIQPALNWIRNTDFYTCPASTIYHDSFEGGLLSHSLTVARNIVELQGISKFNSVPIESAVMVALVHDWCKIGSYSSYEKNVKNDKTGQWEKQKAYKKLDPPISAGHGVSSCFLANRVFNLNLEEFLAIRWHMGVFNVADNEINELQHANETYPLVMLLQWADHLSCVKY